jgi:hypothetical protein
MSEYLLPCTCGKSVPVDVGQAGGQVVCTCGASLDVPTLRQLRHLQRAPVVEVHQVSGWGQRQGIIAASLIAAVLLLGWSGWVWWKEPAAPRADQLLQQRADAVEQQLKTPLGAWESWIGFYRPLAERGLPVLRVANAAQIETEKAEARFLRYMLWAMAACFAVIAVCTAFWPKPVPRTQRR